MARVRRTSTAEFKRDAVPLVAREGKTVSEETRNLGIARSLLRRWIEQSRDQDRGVKPAFRRLFQEVGQPEAIRSDNGAPFASTGVHGLCELDVWWVQLGIVHQRVLLGRIDGQTGRITGVEA